MWFNHKCITHLGARRPFGAKWFRQRRRLYYLELPTQLFRIKGKQLLRDIKHMSEHAAIRSLWEKHINKQPPNATASREFICSLRGKPRACHKVIFTDAWTLTPQHSVLPHVSSSSSPSSTSQTGCHTPFQASMGPWPILRPDPALSPSHFASSSSSPKIVSLL